MKRKWGIHFPRLLWKHAHIGFGILPLNDLKDHQSRFLPQGARGIVREIWEKIMVHSLTDVDSTLSPSTPGYIRQHYTDFASSPTVDTFLKKKYNDQYTSRLKGYFVAPATDSYRFYVRSDDKSLLYFSNNSSPANKVTHRFHVLFRESEIVHTLDCFSPTLAATNTNFIPSLEVLL